MRHDIPSEGLVSLKKSRLLSMLNTCANGQSLAPCEHQPTNSTKTPAGSSRAPESGVNGHGLRGEVDEYSAFEV